MHTVLFYYTLVLLLIYILTAATCLSAFFVSHRRTFLLATVGFLFYFFDVALVFQDDFIAQDLTYQQSSFWFIGNPYLSVLTGTGVLLSFWLVTCTKVGERRPEVRLVPVTLYVLLSLAILQGVPDERWREFLFYSMREAFLFWSYAYLLAHYVTASDESEKARMRSSRWKLLVAVILTACIVLENVWFQLLFDPASTGLWFFAERSFFENMLFLWLAALAFRDSFRVLSLRFENPPTRENERVQESIDILLPAYVREHGLSPRESEVLRLVLLGKDNQNMASEMSLALSTVKVHVHNILRKTGNPNRRVLIHDFWRG